MHDQYDRILDDLIATYRGYSEEHRATTQPYHLARARGHITGYTYNPADEIVREPLIEHVGSLPVVATTLYPEIDGAGVDLGRALTMLAIHDIGELVTGDEITFSKTDDTAQAELDHALQMLPDSLKAIYVEMETNETDTARFAQSIDKMTPDIVDLMTPGRVTVDRYRHFLDVESREIVPLIKAAKHPYMLWNEFLREFHLKILHRLDDDLRPFYGSS